MAVLSAMRKRLAEGSPDGCLWPSIVRELEDEDREIERRIEAAEEQAAAAWSMCAALQKEVRELRQEIATEVNRLDVVVDDISEKVNL